MAISDVLHSRFDPCVHIMTTTKRIRVLITLTEEQHSLIKRAARVAGSLTMQKWAAAILAEAAKEQLDEARLRILPAVENRSL